jgi:hypothetical protein
MIFFEDASHEHHLKNPWGISPRCAISCTARERIKDWADRDKAQVALPHKSKFHPL